MSNPIIFLKAPTSAKGYSLFELMITIAIVAIISAIAIPAYRAYTAEAQLGTARINAGSLRIFLEDWHLENATYRVGGAADYNPEATIELGWTPDGDQDNYTYQVVGATASSYNVVVTYEPSGRWIRCENRMNDCCDGIGAIAASCPPPP